MGAAIPHLLQLSLSLPSILPFPRDEVHVEVLTGTVEVQDEIIPEDEDEDITYQTRGKSTLSITIKIGDGKSDADRDVELAATKGKSAGGTASTTFGVKRGKGSSIQVPPQQMVFQEPEQDDMDVT